MVAGRETGSLVNHLQSGCNSAIPEVGMGCTILSWSDCDAATIVEIGRKVVVVQRDHARRTDKNGMSECQDYEFTRDPNGVKLLFKQARDGSWREAYINEVTGRVVLADGGSRLLIGHRDKYYDFSF